MIITAGQFLSALLKSVLLAFPDSGSIDGYISLLPSDQRTIGCQDRDCIALDRKDHDDRS